MSDWWNTGKGELPSGNTLSPTSSSKASGTDSDPHLRFVQAGPLGEGGYGQVVRYFDNHLNRCVAKKELQANRMDDEHAKLLVNEARLISYLEHPGITPVYDTFVGSDGSLGYMMKIISGEDLDTKLEGLANQQKLMSVAESLRIFTKLCETMAFAHDKGVLHLDLKPSNIMLGTYGEVWLLDWGTGRFYNPERYEQFLRQYGKTSASTEFHTVARGTGTPLFMSLEQGTRPREELTPASDIFSAGVVLYLMLSGKYPFPANTIGDYFLALTKIPPTPLHQHRGSISLRLSELCMQMLEINPNNRPKSFQAVLAELDSIANAGAATSPSVYNPGEAIIREGEFGEEAYQIIEGKVEISTMVGGTRKVLAVRGAGEVIGELAVFAGGTRNATVVALERTQVNRLTKKQMEQELEKLNPWIIQVFQGLANKFIETIEKRVQESKEAHTSPTKKSSKKKASPKKGAKKKVTPKKTKAGSKKKTAGQRKSKKK